MNDVRIRAWDKKGNRMLYVVQINFNDDRVLLTDGFIDGWFAFEDVEIMRYTGFKDSLGNRIFEGDILKIPCEIEGIHGSHSFQEVVNRNNTWITQYLKSETGFKLPRGYLAGLLVDNYEHDMKSLVFNEGCLNDTKIEVIGNTYANSEFLQS